MMKTLFLVLLIAPEMSFVLFAQNGKVQTDTIRAKDAEQVQPKVFIRTADTKRWDASFLYLALTMHIVGSGRSVEQVNPGFGINLRMPLWRFGEDEEFFVQNGDAIGPRNSLVSISLGYHPSRRFFGGLGYAYMRLGGNDDEIESILRKHALKLFGGGGNGRFYFELGAYIPIGKEEYTWSHYALNAMGHSDLFHEHALLPGVVSFGVRLLWYI